MVFAKIYVTGTCARVTELEKLTSGLAGGKILVDYDDHIWAGLSKTVVFRGIVEKDVSTGETVVEIPWEVLGKPCKHLWVGFYGTNSDKNMIIPTVYADLGPVLPGADPSGDESTDPLLPVWAQLQNQIDDLRGNGSPGGGGGSGENGGYYTPSVKQPDNDTLQFGFTPSKAGMPAIVPVEVALPAGPKGNDYKLTEADKKEIAELAADLVEVPDSGGNADQTFETVLALDEVRIGRYAKGVLESTYNRAICTRGYIKPFVVSATLTSADYQFAVAVYNNGAYVRTDGWLASGTVYTFDHDAYQYKMYIGRLDGEYVQDFDGCRQSVKLTISTADILKSYNALEIQSDTERRNTRNAVEYMMRRNYDISYANAPAPIGLTTYVGNNQIVHPKVLYFPNKFGGYMYWMAYTPYPFANEVYENPCVAYSNDGYNWVNVDGNPLDDHGGDGYNSDTHLVYVESTGTLELWYRYVSDYETTPVSEVIYRQTTKDGINWTEKEVVINNNTGNYTQYMSPCIIHDGDKYKMWVVSNSGNILKYYEGMEAIDSTDGDTILLDDTMTVGKVTQTGKVDTTDTNYMYTEKIKLNAAKSFQLTAVNLKGTTVHPALRYVTAYDSDGNVLTDHCLQSVAEASASAGRTITMDASVDSVIISIYKAFEYTDKTITLPGYDGGVTELAHVRDIDLTYEDGDTVYTLWHADVIEDNGKTVLLAMCKSGAVWSLFLATSEDNITFATPKLVMVGNPYGWDNQLYRSSIVNVDGEYRIYYSAQDVKQRYGLGVCTSNTLSNFVGKW